MWVKSADGFTPKDLAERGGHTAVSELLEETMSCAKPSSDFSAGAAEEKAYTGQRLQGVPS